MKKWLPVFITLLLSITSITGHAQCPSNKGQFEITASYGVITSDELSGKINTSENTSGGSGGSTQTYNSGAAFISARYFIYNRLALGFSGGITNERGQNSGIWSSNTVISTYKQSFTTVALEIYYIYAFRKMFEAYTILGVGPSFVNTSITTNATLYAPASTATESHDVLKMQYTPIGIRVGGKLGVFAELGIGYKGILNGGISYKFGRPCWWKAFH